MSKQLAVSSAAAVFAMACLVVLGTQDRSDPAFAGTLTDPVQAEILDFDLPSPVLLTR